MDNKIKIAGSRTIAEWDTLPKKLKSNPNEKDWKKAFDFFERRMNTRYIRPIKVIRCFGIWNGEGFAIVNLQCSLIETIESFYEGWIYLPYKDGEFSKGYYLRKIEGKPLNHINNEQIFINFFKELAPFDHEIDGEDFFRNVRCGLLHETQTKNGWKIKASHSNPEIFYEENENGKILYRNNFQSAIKKVIHNYKRAIVYGEPYGAIPVSELRENFIAKFNRICELSKPKSCQSQYSAGDHLFGIPKI